MFRILTFTILVVTAVVLVSTEDSGASQKERLQQLKKLVLKKATEGSDEVVLKNAIKELLTYLCYAVEGREYTIGDETGLNLGDLSASRKKRSYLYWSWLYRLKMARRNQRRREDKDLVCPTQADPSESYDLRTDMENYPMDDIATELFFKSLNDDPIFFILVEDIAFSPGDLPVVTADENFESNCPSDSFNLVSYQKADAPGGRCYLLQGFQYAANVLFEVCQTESCEGCGKRRIDNSDKVLASRCVNDFQAVQVISYCTNLPENNRIIFDRIILPTSCECQRVECDKA